LVTLQAALALGTKVGVQRIAACKKKNNHLDPIPEFTNDPIPEIHKFNQ
jgi:hypothetical protein